MSRWTHDNAIEVMRAAGYEPLEPYPGVLGQWRCKCLSCGEERTPSFKNVRDKGSRCRKCEDKRQRESRMQTNEKNAIAHVDRLGFDPVTSYLGVFEKWEIQCRTCGVSVRSRALNLVSKEYKCRSCIRNQRAEFLIQKAVKLGWTVMSIPTKLKDPWGMRHRCGYEHSFNPYDLGRYADGCPQCAKGGFDVSRFGFVYFLWLPNLETYKIGITHNLEIRLGQHQRVHEVELLKQWGPLPGQQVVNAEKAVLNDWVTRGAQIYETLGGTEMISTDLVKRDEVIGFVDSLLERSVQQPRITRKPLSITEIVEADRVVKECGFNEAKQFISSGHYTGTLPSFCTNIGLWVNGVLLGVASFGSPTYPQTAASLLPENPGAVTELRRFYLDDCLGHNSESWFLARSMRLLPADKEVVLAYSDENQGHIGTIYQATNFVYLGKTSSSYHYVDEFGGYVHKRIPWNRGRDKGITEREEVALSGLMRVNDAPKHRYVFPRFRYVRKMFEGQPYPKLTM